MAKKETQKQDRSTAYTTLSNGCKFTQPYINPSNWESSKATVKRPWFIKFTFHHPVRGVMEFKWRAGNKFKTLPARQDAARQLLKETIEDLKNGLNPFTGKIEPIAPDPTQIDNNTDNSTHFAGIEEGTINRKSDLLCSLEWAYKKATWVHKAKIDIGGYMTRVYPAIRILQYQNVPIEDITPQHIDTILEKTYTIAKGFHPITKKETVFKWSNYQKNRAKDYLSMHFNVFKKKKILLTNPCHGLEDLPWKTADPIGFTQEQRETIDTHLWKRDPDYANCINIFFHSAARETELLLVQDTGVHLENNLVENTVLKGGQNSPVTIAVKEIAKQFWERALKGCKPGQYLFSHGFRPGDKPIRPDNINKRWRKYVVEELGINVRPYELKHTNLTDLVDKFGSEAAAAAANHTTEDMVKKIYDLRKRQRSHETIKSADNHFGTAPRRLSLSPSTTCISQVAPAFIIASLPCVNCFPCTTDAVLPVPQQWPPRAA